jgi:hypothetical protein
MVQENLRTEALTIQMLKAETTILMPEVFLDLPLENESHCPYILTEDIDGRPSVEVWIDESQPNAVLEERRVRSLQDTASAMLQLNQFDFD